LLPLSHSYGHGLMTKRSWGQIAQFCPSLNVDFSWSSTIQLAYPLTKEHVARENGGGGNWGAGEGGRLNQIKTIGGEAAARSRTNNRCICV
jgi:hypothetical protein